MNFEFWDEDINVPYLEQVMNDVKRSRIKESAY